MSTFSIKTQNSLMKTKLSIAALVLIFTQSVAQMPNYVPTVGLQGYWPFNNNANDQSGNNYNGTVNGAIPTVDRFSNPNSAYSFNGLSDFISTNYQGILGTNSRAVSFWAKMSVAQPAMSCVAWGDNLQATRFQCGFNYVANGATIDGSYGAITYTSAVSVSNGQWHHYVYQFSNSALNMVEVYQDAVLLTQIAHSYNPTNVLNTSAGFNVHFGKVVYGPSPDYFNGQLDDIGIWNRVLSSCEINQLYTSSLPAINISSSNTLTCKGQAATLTANGGTNYQWNTSASGPSIVVSPTITTNYSVTGTTTLGCTGTVTVSLTVIDCTDIEEAMISNNFFTIYPNPTTGKLVINKLKEGTGIEVYNSLGMIIYKTKLEGRELEIDLSEQSNGLYFIKIKNETGTTTNKIIKE